MCIRNRGCSLLKFIIPGNFQIVPCHSGPRYAGRTGAQQGVQELGRRECVMRNAGIPVGVPKGLPRGAPRGTAPGDSPGGLPQRSGGYPGGHLGGYPAQGCLRQALGTAILRQSIRSIQHSSMIFLPGDLWVFHLGEAQRFPRCSGIPLVPRGISWYPPSGLSMGYV